MITQGFLWPLIGWEIITMPGFGERPPMTYQRQGIPSPRLAHVKAEASVSDIVFD